MPTPHDSTQRPPLDATTEHALRNHLAIVIAFCELLLADAPAEDPRTLDLHEIHKAATAAMRLLNPL